jgi:hypothetical protein
MPERRTEGNECGLLPTPVANDDNKSVEAHLRMKSNMPGGPRSKITSLAVMARGGLLPTPSTMDHIERKPEQWEDRKRNKAAQGINLQVPLIIALQKMLPTPCCHDTRDGTALRTNNNMMEGGRHGVNLCHLAAHGMLPTPNVDSADTLSPSASANMAARIAAAKAGQMIPTPDCHAHAGTMRARNTMLSVSVFTGPIGNNGPMRLNPQFVAWMMGYPPDWLEGVECKPSRPSATP